MILKDLGGKLKCFSTQCLCREKTDTKNVKTFSGERVNYEQILVFALFLGT
jgi:hypothetical protein